MNKKHRKETIKLMKDLDKGQLDMKTLTMKQAKRMEELVHEAIERKQLTRRDVTVFHEETPVLH
jgi:hypothetical protein